MNVEKFRTLGLRLLLLLIGIGSLMICLNAVGDESDQLGDVYPVTFAVTYLSFSPGALSPLSFSIQYEDASKLKSAIISYLERYEKSPPYLA